LPDKISKFKIIEKWNFSGYPSFDGDSGIESLDSLSPKDLDSTPISSPATVPEPPQPFITATSLQKTEAETSILTSLLTAPTIQETSTLSSAMLTTLLTSTEIIANLKPVQPEMVSEAVRSINVVAINPLDTTLVNQVSVSCCSCYESAVARAMSQLLRVLKGVQFCCFGWPPKNSVQKVYFGWNGGKIQIWFVANFFTQEILFRYCLTS
jgi:hypothetical protein